MGDDLDAMIVRLRERASPLTDELVTKVQSLEQYRYGQREQEAKLNAKYKSLFGNLPLNPGLAVAPPHGTKPNTRLQRFTQEWLTTLQLMRGLAKEFAALGLRPKWVAADAHPAVHFDQFLHAYYYDYVRAGLGDDDDDEPQSGVDKVEAFHQKAKANPSSALKEAARWWASLPSDTHDEEDFIRTKAPNMRARLSREAIASMGLPEFTEAMRHVNAFRMHARQVKNAEFGLPANHRESIEQRVDRLCARLWEQRTTTGKSVRDTLEFVLWGTHPTDMEHRLWLGVWSEEYKLPHFGQSSLGEAVGWARPDDYPPRNNRTNKALRALGHDVKLFSNL